MKNKLALLTLTFLITAPLIAMEEVDPHTQKRIKLEEGIASTIQPIIKILFKNGEELELDYDQLPTLEKSDTIKNFLEDIPSNDTITISLMDVNFNKKEFEIILNLLNNLDNLLTIDENLQKFSIEELAKLWHLTDYLDAPALLKEITLHLEEHAIAATKHSMDEFSATLGHIPEAIRWEKTQFQFDQVPQSFNDNLIKKIISFDFPKNYEIYSVAFNPAGTLLAAGHWNGAISLFDTSNRDNVKKVYKRKSFQETEPNQIPTLSFSNDGNRLVTSDLLVSMFDITTDKKIKNRTAIMSDADYDDQLTPHTAAVHPKKDIVAVSFLEGEFILYDFSDSQNIQELYRNPNLTLIESITFSPDGNVLVLGFHAGNSMIYNVSTPSDPQLIKTLSGNQPVKSIAFNPQGTLLAIGTPDNIAVYSLSKNFKKIISLNTNSAIEQLVWNKEGNILVRANKDGQIIVTDTSNPLEASDPIVTIPAHEGDIYGLTFNPQGSLLASGGIDRKLQVYDTQAFTALAGNLSFEQKLVILFLINHPGTDINKLPEEVKDIYDSLDSSIQNLLLPPASHN